MFGPTPKNTRKKSVLILIYKSVPEMLVQVSGYLYGLWNYFG